MNVIIDLDDSLSHSRRHPHMMSHHKQPLKLLLVLSGKMKTEPENPEKRLLSLYDFPFVLIIVTKGVVRLYHLIDVLLRLDISQKDIALLLF